MAASPATVLTRPTTCAPCRQLVCPFDQECLDIAPFEVADAAHRLLRREALRAV